MTRVNENLYAVFERGFAAHRARVCLETESGDRYTYADLDVQTAAYARALQAAGAKRGDRITVQTAKSPAGLWLYLACLRAGYVFHPLNDAYRRDELAYFVSDASPSVVICDPESEALYGELIAGTGCTILTLDARGEGTLARAAARAASVAGATADSGHGKGLRMGTGAAGKDVAGTAGDPHASEHYETVVSDAADLAVLLYSSGTTGKPKGAMISHGNLAANITTLTREWGFTHEDCLLHALPIYHAHGLFVGIGCALLSGASMLFLPRFDAAQVVSALPRCTVMMGVPTFYVRMLAGDALTRDACAGVRVFISGSAPLLADTFAAFAERTGHEILERYGITETCMNASNPLQGTRRAGTVGPPLPGVAIRIAGAGGNALGPGDIGDIEVKGPNVFAGYWGKPELTVEAFTEDGYFRTGDKGVVDADGYLSIVGRSKDLIITGGLNVYPREVELLIDALPGVAESAVVGVPHDDFGEAVVAVVVREDGAALGEDDVLRAVAPRLAKFKQPKRVFFTDALPRNAMAKVRKNELRRIYAETFSIRT